MRTECPKCGSPSAWIEMTRYDKILRCMCGYYKVVATMLGKIEIEHNDEPEVKLPRTGTNLWNTVMVVAALKEASSVDITERLSDMGLEFTVSDVSSYLTVLRSRGLVATVKSGRGVAGGSTWKLTDSCSKLVGVRNGA